MKLKSYTAHNKGVLQIVDVANVSFKVLASVCLACAYFPRFREAVPSGIDLSELETRASTCVNSETENTSILNKTAGRQECEDDDDDDDDDKPKKKTPYDWPSMLLRMKRLMPLIFPRHSRLSYVLVGKMVSCSLALYELSTCPFASRLCWLTSARQCGKSPSASSIRLRRQ